VTGDALSTRETVSLWWRVLAVPLVTCAALAGMGQPLLGISILTVCYLLSLLIHWQQSSKPTLLGRAYLIFAAVTVLGCLHTQYLANSVAVAAVVVGSVVLFAVLSVYRLSELQPLYLVICIGNILLCGEEIYTWLRTGAILHALGFSSLQPFRRILNTSSSLGYSGNDALLPLVGLGIAVLALLYSKRFGAAWSLAALSLLTSVVRLLLTTSRLVYLSCAMGLLCCIISACIAKPRTRLAGLRELFVIGTLGVAIVLSFGAGKEVLGTAGLWKTEAQKRSGLGRLTIALRAEKLYRQYPIWGVGPGNYSYAACLEGGIDDKRCNSQALNGYLQSLTEQGPLGLLSLLFLWIGAALAVCKSFRNEHIPKSWPPVALGITVALLLVNLGQSAFFATEMLAATIALWLAILNAGTGEPV